MARVVLPQRETLASDYFLRDPFDARTYPAPRRKRAGPPPSSQGVDFDPFQARGAPIRGRPIAFVVNEVLGRCLLGLGPFLGPGLVKRLDVTHSNLTESGVFAHFNIFVNTVPYVTAANQAEGTLPAGTPIIEAQAAGDAVAVYAQEGGIASRGQAINGNRFVFDYYVGDPQFFLGLTIRNPINAAGNMSGVLLVYEGILPTDFPAILG